MNTPVTFDFLRSQCPLSAGCENLSMRGAVQRLSTDDALFLTIPDYQRSVVWTDHQCALFIGFIAEGGKAPPIFVQRWDARLNLPDEIIDGLQRLTAIRRFMANEVPMELADGRQAYLRDFSEDGSALPHGLRWPEPHPAVRGLSHAGRRAPALHPPESRRDSAHRRRDCPRAGDVVAGVISV